MLRFEETTVDGGRLENYAKLFARCFPSSTAFNLRYLAWLYRDNPDGQIVGFDAVDDGKIVATYVCTPARAMRNGQPLKALLSLNTATHPRHQGRGLFTKLAQATYERARQAGFDIIFGVANRNSIHGFSTKLGFQDVHGLNARIGIGWFPRGNTIQIRERSAFHREWSADALRWRVSNPNNPLAITRDHDGGIRLIGKTQYPGITVQAALFQELPADSIMPQTDVPFSLASVSLGLEPAGTSTRGLSMAIPDRLKPSPLRLIYRNLHDPADRIDPAAILFRFIDFDPY